MFGLPGIPAPPPAPHVLPPFGLPGIPAPPPAPIPIPPGLLGGLPRFISGGGLRGPQTGPGAPLPASKGPESEIVPQGVSAAAAAAAQAIGCLACAAAIELYGLANFIAGLFGGRPKFLDTAQAIARLRASGLWQFQALANNLEVWLRNGVPLSTSDPQLQAQLRGWINGTLTRSGLGLTAQQSLVMDTLLWQVLASETAQSGSMLDRMIQMFQLANREPTAQPPPPRQVPGPRRTPSPFQGPGGEVPNPFLPPLSPPIGQPPPPVGLPPPPTPLTLQPGPQPFATRPLSDECSNPGLDVIARARCMLQRIPEVGGILDLSRQLPFTPENIARIGTQIGQTIGGRFIETQPTPQTLPTSGIHIDVTQDCPSCRTVAQQQQQLQRSIRQEVGQQEEKRLTEIQGQIDRLEQLEEQPRETRDITRELEQKQELQRELEQLQREERQILQQPGPQPPIGPVPHIEIQPGPQPPGLPPPSGGIQPSQLVKICEDQCASEKGTPDYEHCIDACWQRGGKPLPRQAPHHVQFCVGCASTEDAISFLNGEVSQCSVVPGSTREV